jgi:hypothetical protein
MLAVKLSFAFVNMQNTNERTTEQRLLAAIRNSDT